MGRTSTSRAYTDTEFRFVNERVVGLDLHDGDT